MPSEIVAGISPKDLDNLTPEQEAELQRLADQLLNSYLGKAPAPKWDKHTRQIVYLNQERLLFIKAGVPDEMQFKPREIED